MSNAPTECLYCDGEGNSSAGGRCGFCENGIPLDTQADWDASWGRLTKIHQTNLHNINCDLVYDDLPCTCHTDTDDCPEEIETTE